ncbi:BON domain-containing protein [Achromobacter denitrificans]|jgi:osmotically-inducible protein OsmY|uniref:BON domain-containing protein n=1 Tax=Achromobacter denitrificans TaxID=32002 RepID=A0A3R9MRV0_ACHDE|nr:MULTISPECIES: BON domain-containing protein [Achromobacter]ASC64995.1 phospholipid-binding protein [Achromobacter denitrificans]MBV2160145.1 BON domain-containing protein [Achromobacter denitrificans]MDF3850762.1 BON domain-containing protein [Achromobacter denitrificans]MDF3859141.1 BON domain-containing protein [Achromobacter denitrificans]MDF3941085.1 BON domain-containing protein [Achromobacter denitrificans]
MISDARTAVRPLMLAAALSAATLSLSACAPLIVGGAAATTAVVVTDRRTSGVQLEDQNMAFKAQSQISQKLGDTARVNAMAYGGHLLLTGDVPTEEAKSQATAIAQGVENVKQVINQLTVGPIASFGVRSNDTWLTSKVKSTLLNTKYVPSGTIAVTTDHSVVYLMGKVTQAEGEYAANATADVGGVAKVVKLFETISREEAIRLSNSGSQSTTTEAKAPIESGAGAASDNAGGTGGGVEVMPIK